MPVDPSSARTAQKEKQPAVAVATMPQKLEKTPWVEGKPVTIHNRSLKTVKYYFADGRMIAINRGQSGEVPENVADIFERESNGLVSRADAGPGAADLASKYQSERVRASNLESQVAKLQAQLEEIKRGSKA